MAFVFCPYCRTGLIDKIIENKPRRFCNFCGFVHYEQLKVGVCALIMRVTALSGEGEILLLKRATEPFLGKWTLLAGFVDHDESPRDAIRREVFEEAGLEDVDVGGLFNIYFYDDDPRGNGIIVVYRCWPKEDKLSLGGIKLNEENNEAGFFDRAKIKKLLKEGSISGSAHDRIIKDWAESP